MSSRSSTSRKTDAPGSSRQSCRLIVAHWSWPVPQMLRATRAPQHDRVSQGTWRGACGERRVARGVAVVRAARALREEEVPAVPLGEGEVGPVAGSDETEGRHRRRLEDGLHGEDAREHERSDDDGEEA